MEATEFLLFVALGLFAQLVDGALGMAYGLVSNSVLLALGIPPAAASATVHMAEIATTGVSGAAHARLGNVDRRLLWRLAIPGAIGGVIGAVFLSHVPAQAIRPYVNAYLLVLGILIVLRALGRSLVRAPSRHPGPLGFAGGLLDAIGGGGWGPITTSTLLARNGAVRTTIGSVNAAEFVVTLAISIAFATQIGASHWRIVLGLLIGGVIAAPIAALLVRRLPEKPVMIAVGLLVVGISLWQLLR